MRNQQRCHEVFLLAVKGDPRNLNIAELARHSNIPTIKLWRYVTGKSKWRPDEWFTVMVSLGRLDLIEKFAKDIQARVA